MSRESLPRRRLLQRLVLAASLAPLMRTALAANQPLVSPSGDDAKKVSYVENAKDAKAAAGNNCANCGLYQGASGAAQGPCQLFPNKDVKAAGWCSSWVGQM
jgi:hypothetical protein